MTVYRNPIPDLRWRLEGEASWRPPTDVYETDDSAVVIVEIAGLQESDLQVALNGRTLIVTGERRDPAEKLAYQQMEIRYGKFRTEVHLPWALDSEGQSATYEEGFLRITLRKAQSRRVPVTTGDAGA
jgi:HSP20 family molecular chaperone IbpA